MTMTVTKGGGDWGIVLLIALAALIIVPAFNKPAPAAPTCQEVSK